MMTLIKPGLLTSIQDIGRYGYQKYGIISGGAMDTFAHRVANLLVGNDENQATLEITLLGPTLDIEKDSIISLCGGDLSPTVNGEPIPLWRPVLIKKGSRLVFGPCKTGCRTYLAAAGGFAVPSVMNSRSTYLRAGIGGFHGRMLKSGDKLALFPAGNFAIRLWKSLEKKMTNQNFLSLNWLLSSKILPIYRENPIIRILEGREFHLFSEESLEKLFSDKFMITSESDRMGYRLQGTPLLLKKSAEILSEAVHFGTIQVPADGNPIILMADRQTIGGYPKIAQIATIDLPLLAQAKPGNFLRFKKISHHEAQALYLKREHAIYLLKQGLSQKFL